MLKVQPLIGVLQYGANFTEVEGYLDVGSFYRHAFVVCSSHCVI
jgi:hypothetical protein